MQDAEKNYRLAIALQVDFFEAHSNLGVTLKNMDKLEDAEANYRRAVALKTDYADGFAGLADTLQISGRYDEAQRSAIICWHCTSILNVRIRK